MSEEDYITIIEKLKYERMQLIEENEKLKYDNAILNDVRKNLIDRVEMKKTEWRSLAKKYYGLKDDIRAILFDISTLHDGGFVKVGNIRPRLEKLLEKE